MGPMSKNEYFKAIASRYEKAPRYEKVKILDEYCINCSYNRKYAIHKLSSFKPTRRPSLPPKKRGPKSKYGLPEVIKPLQEIWLAANLPCSKRLKAILPLWIPYYELEFGVLPWAVSRRLYQISPATIDRTLKLTRISYTGRSRSTTKPGLILKDHIPIQTNQWDERKLICPRLLFQSLC
jgi:hypothetical protein